jgi:hypothetical protein
MVTLTMPPGDLCDDLRVSPSESAPNHLLRIYVGVWMIQQPGESYKDAALRLIAMYEAHASSFPPRGLLYRGGYLTDELIAREVMGLLDKEQEST